MKNIPYILLPTLLLIAISACNISGAGIPIDKKDYVGYWQANEMRLEINKSGYIKYERVKSITGSSTSISAPIQKFKGDDFIVGALGVNTVFDVSVTPHEEAGVWKMTVDGVELTRQ